MKISHRLLLGLVLSVACVANANAVLIFDNFKGTNASNYTEETRNATRTFGTVLNSLQTTLVNDIRLRWRANDDMDVTLGIWDSMLGGTVGSLNWTPTANNLLYSQTISVVGNPGGPLDYLTFTGVDFTFQANHRYDIGIWGTNGTLLGSWDIHNGCDNVNTVQGGFESINSNANIEAGSSNEGYACVDPHIQLLRNDQGAVPEPLSLALVGLGLGAMGFVRRAAR
ncbi:MAG: PEP-CTERM sorting domain-containing protein [Gammaproteobacteria bacterium]